jgi:hypothetical protein
MAIFNSYVSHNQRVPFGVIKGGLLDSHPMQCDVLPNERTPWLRGIFFSHVSLPVEPLMINRIFISIPLGIQIFTGYSLSLYPI